MRAQGILFCFTIALATSGSDCLRGAAPARQTSTPFLVSLPLSSNRRDAMALAMGTDPENNYESTDAVSKGIVSSLTALVNSFPAFGSPVAPSSHHEGPQSTAEDDLLPSLARFGTTTAAAATTTTEKEGEWDLRSHGAPPFTPQELLERIRSDYVTHNYLWTGNLDVACFDKHCRFTDPTLSFTGTAQFARNVRNLRPFVDWLVGSCRSELLDSAMFEEEGYVQTRWNMVGTLDGLPWKPTINVVGRTKFWFERQPSKAASTAVRTGCHNDEASNTASNPCSDSCYRVTYYDESWELPAYKTLLQLVTPGRMQ